MAIGKKKNSVSPPTFQGLAPLTMKGDSAAGGGSKSSAEAWIALITGTQWIHLSLQWNIWTPSFTTFYNRPQYILPQFFSRLFPSHLSLNTPTSEIPSLIPSSRKQQSERWGGDLQISIKDGKGEKTTGGNRHEKRNKSGQSEVPRGSNSKILR